MNEDVARQFANKWNARGDEERDYLIFWTTMFRDVFNIAKPEEIMEPPQYPVQFESSTGHIDILIPRTKVLIEQKSFDVDLSRKIRQSDGELLTPFEQAKRYADALPLSVRPRWIIVCNFAEFNIYDLNQMDSLEYLLGARIYEPTVIKLENFRNDYGRLKFIVDPNADIKPEIKISIDAAKIVRKICKAIDKDYAKRDNNYINNLSKLCARLVFCFYADDEKLFTQTKFADYLKDFSAAQLQDALQNFFDALNTPEDNRDALKNFPYVDGGLFDEKIPIPPLNNEFKFAVDRAHIFDNLRFDELGNFSRFSWREISPPIFGAMFESVFNDETRRKDGIHYTSVENIHKVIDPLFFDDLSKELAAIKRRHIRNRADALKKFQDKLAAINVLDPACGSGNFLTETYLSLRRLENEVLAELRSINAEIPDNPIKVTPQQFYGIEINDFAVSVARLALWIAEIQMLRKTSWIIGRELKELPLRKYISIHKANALRVDWKAICSPDKISYIIGNPPYRGYSDQKLAQKDDMRRVFADNPKSGKLDYVAAWFRKAADFIQGTEIRCAFVSTNSICQGEQCDYLWRNLYERLNIHVDFCHRTFKWLSDSDNMAHVHCVIVGFSQAPNDKPKKIFDGDKVYTVDNINFYLIDDEIIFIKPRRKPIQDDVPKMIYGNKPTDNGNLIVKDDEYEPFIVLEPAAQKYIHLYLGAEEFINGEKRYCLWLEGVSMSEIEKMPLVAERVEACRQVRLRSSKPETREDAATPHLFQEVRQPTTNYLLVPRHSSERRKYIPISFMSPNIIASDAAQFIPDATPYYFGVLTSSIHMAWLRTVGGRFKSDYRYSVTVVYNNFVWCKPDKAHRRLIEESAQKILDVRARYADWTYAKLYNEETMPDDLRSAHKWNDYNVALAYGFDKFLDDEAKIVAELMRLYKQLTGD